MATETYPDVFKRLLDLAQVDGEVCPTCGRAALPTQRELAARLGLAPSAVNHFAKGRMEPSLSQVRRIAETLKLTPAQVVAALWPEDES